MAELHVQTKKHNPPGSRWLWIVLALLVAGVVIWYLATRNKDTNSISPANNTVGRSMWMDNNPFDIEHILESAGAYLC